MLSSISDHWQRLTDDDPSRVIEDRQDWPNQPNSNPRPRPKTEGTKNYEFRHPYQSLSKTFGQTLAVDRLGLAVPKAQSTHWSALTVQARPPSSSCS